MDLYCEVTNTHRDSLRKADTPFLSGGGNATDEEQGGQLSDVAAKFLVQLLCGARLARWDLGHVCVGVQCHKMDGPL